MWVLPCEALGAGRWVPSCQLWGRIHFLAHAGIGRTQFCAGIGLRSLFLRWLIPPRGPYLVLAGKLLHFRTATKHWTLLTLPTLWPSAIASLSHLSWERFCAVRTPVIGWDPPGSPKTNLPIWRCLTLPTSAKSLLPSNVTYSQVPQIRMRTS